VRHGIFHFHGKLGETPVIPFRDKQRIIAEPSFSGRLRQHVAFHGTGKLRQHAAVPGKHHDAAEPRGRPVPRLHAGAPQFLHHAEVIPRMVPFLPAEGGGPDSGAPVQHIHLQPGIIRQQDAGDAFGSGKRLERGVLRKRDSRFIHGRSLGIVGKILHFPFPGQHGADFPGLVGVACGNHQQRQFLFHNHQSLTVKLA